MGDFSEFERLDEESLIEYIKTVDSLSSKLGNNFDEVKVKEVGDGNLNFVYIVVASAGSFVLKQYLEPPHIILRKGLIAGIQYPFLAHHMSDYMSKTLFCNSTLGHSTTNHKLAVAEFCGNVEMCRLTEQVVFSDPYQESPFNHWTSPHLDNDAKSVREDDALKLEVAELKSKFIERSQSLIHGDLHTGSIMVTPESTQVIDSEFAFYGPMGYDVGAFIGNLILAFFAQDGHADQHNDRKIYKEWILRTIEESWNLFQKKFIALWDEQKDGPGEAYLPAIYNSTELWHLAQSKYMTELFHDTLGFGAAKMIRRIVGVAHVEDFESISDTGKRAECERRALELAKFLLKERRKLVSIIEVVSAIRQMQ